MQANSAENFTNQMSNEKLTKVLKNKEEIVIIKGEMCMAFNLKNDVIFKAFFVRKGKEEVMRPKS